ncbi:hypothetical protein GCM10009527_043040 [Actinomadura nitritigenes]
MGLGVPAALGAVGGGVGEADVLAGDAGGGEQGQDGGVGGGWRVGVRRERDGGPRERGDAVPQPFRQDLLEFGQGALGGVLDAGDGAGGAQPDRNGGRLVVVQQQRRHRGAGGEPVAAGAAVHGADGVAEGAQAVDVAADGAAGDAEAVGEFGAGPVAGRLQQGQQPQQPSGGIAHGSILPTG